MKLLLLVTLLTGATAHSISRRALKRYGNAFICYYDAHLLKVEHKTERGFVSRIYDPLMGYGKLGCICQALIRRAAYEVDVVRCCLELETCYSEGKNLEHCKNSEYNPYYYFCSGRYFFCSDENNACQAAICNCDRQAAICIFRKIPTSRSELFGYERFC
uniref:phospholipase A2-like isoform X2 n=1 Tax=Myodes glareolus TaxID=447135 RepID=UPI00202231DA|nr:phospholipase A2-like isoform X2 [Myodes glareolus]